MTIQSPPPPGGTDPETTYSVEKQIDLSTKSYSQGQLVRRRFFRHRGAMVSLAVLIAVTIFGWKGLGAMFRAGLNTVDPGPVMAYYLVAGGAAVLMNMMADIAYAFLDPRIRR